MTRGWADREGYAGWAAVVGVCLSVLASTPCSGFAPDVEEGEEFRFAGRLAEIWRATGPRGDRWVAAPGWVRLASDSGRRAAWMGDRVAVRLRGDPDGSRARREGERLGLRWSRTGAGAVQIFQARDPWSAARIAARWAARPDAELSTPVLRRNLARHGGYAPRPDDPFYPDQWHLENRDTNRQSAGPDLQVRDAWPTTRGQGVTVAICDDGFEVEHPDLQRAASGGMHFDFIAGRTNASTYGSHSTCVAGLVAAAGGNGIGVSGVAPSAGLASWMVFDSLGEIASDEALMDMFQYRIGEIAIQNHSWGNAGREVSRPTPMEDGAISNALENGRGGLGVVMVRSGGNDRDRGNDVNDDAYANDPRVIAVAAVRRDGRTASYSNPGACLLVGAPSGDEEDLSIPLEGVATTDRMGSRGYNRQVGPNSLSDYALRSSGFSGTSASAPQISGLAALILSAHPGLSARDVQQILLHAARSADTADPDRRRNGAGYWVEHNTGFGVPDAGRALRLAASWTARPPLVQEVVSDATTVPVPDAGLRLWIRREGIADKSVVCEATPGLHPDEPTDSLPLVHLGPLTGPTTQDLSGKAALIQRGGNTFREKLGFAARAGAKFAVFYNNTGGLALDTPGFTEFVGIPAVFVSQTDGESLVAALAAGEKVFAQARLESVAKTFDVARPMVCEHVGLRVRSNHSRRGDLRITLVSPSGTRSVLQRRNFDSEPGPVDWTYWSTQHFYEPSPGRWRAEFGDEVASVEGEILATDLILRGVDILDSDADGLDDAWERRWFGNLGGKATDDADRDGSSSAREQVLGTDPTRADEPFRITMNTFDRTSFRLSWPTVDGAEYRVLRRGLVDGVSVLESTVAGRYPERDWVVPGEALPGATYRIERVSP